MRWQVLIIGLPVILVQSCKTDLQSEKNDSEKSGSATIIIDNDRGENSDLASPELADLQINVAPHGIFIDTLMVFDVDCGPTWKVSGVQAKAGDTVKVLAKYSCQLTLTGFDDGIHHFRSMDSNLTIEVSSAGFISQVYPAEYVNIRAPSEKGLFIALQEARWYSILIDYLVKDFSFRNSGRSFPYGSQEKRNKRKKRPPKDQPIQPSITEFSVSLGGAVPAPKLVNLDVLILDYTNGEPSSCTLMASVVGATGCKVVDNSLNTYDPSSWLSVDKAYSDGAAQVCPPFSSDDPGFFQGNWTHYWVSGKKTLIIWANTVNSLNAYVTANIGP